MITWVSTIDSKIIKNSINFEVILINVFLNFLFYIGV